VLISTTMMVLSRQNNWSELLRLVRSDGRSDRLPGRESPRDVSNPAQNRVVGSGILNWPEESLPGGSQDCRREESGEGRSMEINIRRFRSRLRARLTSAADRFSERLAMLRPGDKDSGSQRMCPFCGLITPRRKACCLECGKSFKLA
jgi:hypothetical protein